MSEIHVGVSDQGSGKWKVRAIVPEFDKSSSGRLLVGKWTHILLCHMLSNGVGWKWEVGNGKCLQLGLLVGNANLSQATIGK